MLWFCFRWVINTFFFTPGVSKALGRGNMRSTWACGFHLEVTGCRCRRHNGLSFYPAPSATMSLTAASTSPSAWAARTPSARRACTNCTARPVLSTRRPLAPTSMRCRSTVPCCSWWGRRWVGRVSFCFLHKHPDIVFVHAYVLGAGGILVLMQIYSI